MKTRRVKGNRFCALKLDMMKAYDRLEWPYLKAVMIKLGFSPRFTETVNEVCLFGHLLGFV